MVAGLAYNGKQDAQRLLGLSRPLRYHEQLVLNLLVLEHAEAAVQPLDLLNVLGGGGASSRSHSEE